MADPRRRSPLEGRALGDFSVRSGGTLAVAELPFLTQLDVRARGADLPGVNETRPLAFLAPDLGSGGQLLGLGPDEWLAVGAPGEAGQLEAAVRAASPTAVSIVDVSAQRTALVLSGPRVRDLLAHGCALDLAPAAFPVGRCAQTMVAHAQVIIWRTGADEFRVLVRASFAGYLAAWLLDAAAEMLLAGQVVPRDVGGAG